MGDLIPLGEFALIICVLSPIMKEHYILQGLVLDYLSCPNYAFTKTCMMYLPPPVDIVSRPEIVGYNCDPFSQDGVFQTENDSVEFGDDAVS